MREMKRSLLSAAKGPEEQVRDYLRLWVARTGRLPSSEWLWPQTVVTLTTGAAAAPF
jgi:hypothetical protein